MSLTLHHSTILSSDMSVRLTRASLTANRPAHLHDHDFFELFWVQNGQVRHHLAAEKDLLVEGDLVLLRPGQAHGLQGRGTEPLVVSLCLHPDLINGMPPHYPQFEGQLFWSDSPFPLKFHRNIKQMANLNQAALHLERSNGDALAATAFLLPLFADLLPLQALPQDAPDWLVRACADAMEPEVFRKGAAGLVARTGRAHPHVSRTMRRFLGQTPSEYVNNLRMDHAARMLTTDNEPLPLIAADCGIPNLSHFHKLFRVRHGLTPLQYRQQFQRDVVQPR